jgi:hypothetical protein
MTNPPPIRLAAAQHQVRALEVAIAQARDAYREADPAFLAAHLRSMIEDLHGLRSEIDAALGVDAANLSVASIWIRLQGGSVGEGRAPVHVISRVLDGLQTGVRQVAAFLETGRSELYWTPKQVALDASLDVLALARGSARIAIAPTKTQLRLLDSQRPLAEEALGQLVIATRWAQLKHDDAALETIVADAVLRRQVASRIKEIAPSPAGGFHVLEMSGNLLLDLAGQPSLKITLQAFEHASAYLRRRQREEVTFQGQLVAIDIERTVFDLRHGPRRIHCHFEEAQREIAKGLIERSVEVAGTGYFRIDSETPERIDVRQVRPLTPEEQARLT